MVAQWEYSFVQQAERFQQPDVDRIFHRAEQSGAQTVIIDLAFARDATTAAFAHLILLRRRLRQRGRDLRLVNLRERAERVYEVNRLSAVLPRG